MGRQGNDPIVFQSSIVLLQERFKQLQRVKEKREEEELHRMFVEPKLLLNPTMHYYEPSKLFFHFFPPKSSPPPPPPPSSSSTTTTTSSSSQVSSLSLWSNSQSSKLDNFQYQCMGIKQAPLLMSFRPAEQETSSVHGCAYKFDDSNYDVDDVDTSLHL